MPTNQTNQSQPLFVDVFEARYLGRAMRRHGPVVLVMALLGAVGAGWNLLTPRVYRAEAVLLVNIQSVRIGADGVPLDVELIPPARRTVGTICQSDAVMLILSARLAGETEPAWPSHNQLDEMVKKDSDLVVRTPPVRSLHSELYFDQLSQEMAALRAVDRDPVEAARMANTWAEVCRQMLVMAYGTTAEELGRMESRIEQARHDTLAARQAVDELRDDADAATRLERTDALDRAQRILEEYNQRYAELKVRLDDSREVARIVSYAAPPVTPINPSTRLIVGLFTLAGFFLGLGVALFRGPGAVK